MAFQSGSSDDGGLKDWESPMDILKSLKSTSSVNPDHIWKIPNYTKLRGKSDFRYEDSYLIILDRNPEIDLSFRFKQVSQQSFQTVSISLEILDKDSHPIRTFCSDFRSSGPNSSFTMHTNIPQASLGGKSDLLVDGSLVVNFLIKSTQAEEDNSHAKLISSPVMHKITRPKSSIPISPDLPKYTSREPLPYNGLKNQGATCYLNSVVQSLYHLPIFKKLIYEIPTQPTDSDPPIPLSLQRLFARLDCRAHSASTLELTKSFGWSSAETVIQQDIHEFTRLLFEVLEKELAELPQLSTLKSAFQGKIKSEIFCTNVPFSKSTEELFYDLTMNVKGFSSLEESFNNYTAIEKLQDQYDTGEYGKQKAQLRASILCLPMVLTIHLRRFEYDFEMGRTVKLQTYFSFPSDLDLSDYISSDSPDFLRSKFSLYGVLVHSGGSSAGHYCAYLRLNGEWVKFNDSLVTRVTNQEAIEKNYGGKDSIHCAYELIYVSKSDQAKVFDIGDFQIPEHLKMFLKSPSSTRLNSPESDQKSFVVYDSISIQKASVCGFLGLHNQFGTIVDLSNSMNASEVYTNLAQRFGFDAEKTFLWTVSTNGQLIRPLQNDGETKVRDLSISSLFIDSQFSAPKHKSEIYLIFAYIFLPYRLPPLIFLKCVQSHSTGTFKQILSACEGEYGKCKIFYISEAGEVVQFEAQRTVESIFEGRRGCPVIVQPEELIGKDDRVQPEEVKELALCQYYYHFPDKVPKLFENFYHSASTQLSINFLGNKSDKKSIRLTFPSDISVLDLHTFIAAFLGEEFDPKQNIMLLFQKGQYNPIDAENTDSVMKIADPSGAPKTIFATIVPSEPPFDPEQLTWVSLYFSEDGFNRFSAGRCFFFIKEKAFFFVQTLVEWGKVAQGKECRILGVIPGQSAKIFNYEDQIDKNIHSYIIDCKDNDVCTEGERLIQCVIKSPIGRSWQPFLLKISKDDDLIEVQTEIKERTKKSDIKLKILSSSTAPARAALSTMSISEQLGENEVLIVEIQDQVRESKTMKIND